MNCGASKVSNVAILQLRPGMPCTPMPSTRRAIRTGLKGSQTCSRLMINRLMKCRGSFSPTPHEGSSILCFSASPQVT